MSTASLRPESSISGEAAGLLDCFTNGLDEVVYEVAESLAKKRTAQSGQQPAAVEIEVQDVRKAGELVVSLLKELVAGGRLSAEIVPALDQMLRCASSHCG